MSFRTNRMWPGKKSAIPTDVLAASNLFCQSNFIYALPCCTLADMIHISVVHNLRNSHIVAQSSAAASCLLHSTKCFFFFFSLVFFFHIHFRAFSLLLLAPSIPGHIIWVSQGYLLLNSRGSRFSVMPVIVVLFWYPLSPVCLYPACHC